MPIFIGNIYIGQPGTGGIATADNGLNLSTPTNVELGGALTKDTTVDNKGLFQLDLGDITSANGLLQLAPGSAAMAVDNVYGAALTITDGNILLSVFPLTNLIQIEIDQALGIIITDSKTNHGMRYAADYSAAIILNNNAITSTRAVNQLIAQSLTGYAQLSGAVFTGNISALNLSGTNTGDQNLAPYALIAGQVFTGNISAPNLSGTNTGDQNLTPYALLASPTLTGTPAAPTAPVNNNTTQLATTAFVLAQIASVYQAAVKLGPLTATTTILSFASVAANAVYRIDLYISMTAFISGSGVLSLSYTNFAGTAINSTIQTQTSVGDPIQNPKVINVKASTTVTLTYTITGTNTSNVGAAIEFLW